MVVVAAGSSERFGGDKLTLEIAGRPLLWHTVQAVIDLADRCVVVLREDLFGWFGQLDLDVDVVAGGPTRTASEFAGVGALDDAYELTGIHDGARPVVSAKMINALFDQANRVGGAVPVLPVEEWLVDAEVSTVSGLYRAQTPQVFRTDVLSGALERAVADGYSGHDTADVVQRYTDLQVAGVTGEPANIKVTYPDDLKMVESMLRGPART